MLIVGPTADCGLPLHGPFLSHVPNVESVTASWHLLHAHCLPLLDSLWVVFASSLILDLKHASLALSDLGAKGRTHCQIDRDKAILDLGCQLVKLSHLIY